MLGRKKKKEKPTSQEWRGLFLKGFNSKVQGFNGVLRVEFDRMGHPVVWAGCDHGENKKGTVLRLEKKPGYGILDGFRFAWAVKEWAGTCPAYVMPKSPNVTVDVKTVQG